jgi:hypothetical protein
VWTQFALNLLSVIFIGAILVLLVFGYVKVRTIIDGYQKGKKKLIYY